MRWSESCDGSELYMHRAYPVLAPFKSVQISRWFWTINMKLSLIAMWGILFAIFHESLGFPLAN